MPSTTLRATATGLPNRRTALASLVGLGAALALPAAARAATNPDAALIRLAATIEATAAKATALWRTRSRLEDKADALKPAAPTAPTRTKSDVQVTHGDDGSVTVVAPNWTPTAEELAANERHKEAVEAWEEECDRVERRVGLRAAERLCGRHDQRMKAAALALADMKPATIEGLAAKARAAIAANPDHAFADRWMSHLSASVLCDAIAIGGDA